MTARRRIAALVLGVAVLAAAGLVTYRPDLVGLATPASDTAPYAGLHGWYWENRGDDGVLIALKTAGFYTAAVMISEGEVFPMEIQDPPPPEPIQ